MEIAHLETNFQRLLTKCEDLAENQSSDNWRFEKYVESLEQFLAKLNTLTVNKPSQDTLKTYSKRCDFLKQLTLLSRKTSEPVSVSPTPILNNPGSIITKKDIKPKQIYHKVQLNQENSTRQQLLEGKVSKKKDEEGENAESIDMNKILTKQRENQEKLALEMLKSVESIKNNSLIAKKIIEKDNIVLDKLDTMAENNSKNLATVNNHLSHRVSKSCNCWIWLMIVLIVIIFVMMVLFMKLFPKNRSGPDSISYAGDGEKYTFFENQTIVIGNNTMHTSEL